MEKDLVGATPLDEFFAQKAKERQELERLQTLEKDIKVLMATWAKALRIMGLGCHVPLHVPFEQLGKAMGWVDEEATTIALDAEPPTT